jgi:hypothetical protein
MSGCRASAMHILLRAGGALVAIAMLLFGTSGCTTNSDRYPNIGVPVAGPDTKSDLRLGHPSLVTGTEVMRADLVGKSTNVSFSSGGTSFATRNILFIEPNQKTAHWLLPDNAHSVQDLLDIADEKESNERPVIGTAVLVKQANVPAETAVGRLLLFDPPGRHIVEVSDNVRDIQVASIRGGRLTILYERERQLHLEVFDPHTITKVRDQVIDVPLLK